MAGIASGFSGESLAISSAFRSARVRLASSNSAVVVVPARLPKRAVTARLRPDDAPEVVAVLRAKRRFARSLPLSVTSVSSALLSDSALSVSAFACCSVHNIVIALY